MGLTPGARVGAYEILALLGRGGMGEVWRARDRTLHRDVALKVVSGSLADAPEILGRFEREGQLLASLNHPHIAAIYGVEQSTAGVALVLELVEGPTLADLIARGPVPASEALRIGRQIAEALEAAHDRGIIHRDLKPANVKLTSNSEVKVLDFGLAKIADEFHGHHDASLITSPVLGTEAGVVLGTAAYMSPEQAKGQAVDRRSDIWSFGCVLYEMLTARRAFEGNSLSEVIAAVLTADVEFTRLPGGTPPAVRELLRRCLDRSPRGRLRDIGEARIVLEHPDAMTSALMPQTAAAGRTRRLGARAAVRLAGTLLIGMLLGAAGAAMWMARRPQALPADGMHLTLPLAPAALLAPSSEYRRPSDTAIAISRNGRVVIFAGETGTGAAAQSALYRRELHQPLATLIEGTMGAKAGYLSPDAESLAFVGPDATLRRVAVAGGTPREISALDLRAFGGRVAGGSWGEDGMLVLGSHVGPLWRVDSAGGTPAPLTTLTRDASDYAHRMPHHLPNGRGLLYTAVADPLNTNPRVFVLPRDAVAPRLLLENASDARHRRSGDLTFVRDGTLMIAPFDMDTLTVTGDARPALQRIMQALGSDNPWLNTGAAQYAVSDTGTLVYAGGGLYPPVANRLMWLRRDGSTEAVGAPGQSLLGPRISPDGTAIVVAQIADPQRPLIIFDTRRGLWTPLVGLTGGGIAFPLWTPDGQHLVFVQNGSIQRMRTDGSAAAFQVTERGPRPRVPSDVSPDGRLLAFVEMNTPTKTDIWVTALDRSATPTLTVQTSGDDVHPAFSPDGRWLAYGSDDSGAMEVFVQAFPAPGPRVQVSAGGGNAPIWARNGRTLSYVKPGAEPVLVEVTLETAPTLRAGTPRTITRFPYLVSGPARSHDAAADGRRFVVTTWEPPVAAPVTELQVILNWSGTAP